MPSKQNKTNITKKKCHHQKMSTFPLSTPFSVFKLLEVSLSSQRVVPAVPST